MSVCTQLLRKFLSPRGRGSCLGPEGLPPKALERRSTPAPPPPAALGRFSIMALGASDLRALAGTEAPPSCDEERPP